MCCAMLRRIPLSGSLLDGSGRPGGIAGACSAAWASAKARTSASTTRPLGPVAVTWDSSTPSLDASLRAPGSRWHDCGCGSLGLSEGADVGLDNAPSGPVGVTCEMSTPRLAATRRAPGVERTAPPACWRRAGRLCGACLVAALAAGGCGFLGGRLFALGEHVTDESVNGYRRALIDHRVEPAASDRFEVVVELLSLDLGDDFALVDLVALAPGKPDDGALGHEVAQPGHHNWSSQFCHPHPNPLPSRERGFSYPPRRTA